jgi:hypothetical protein
MKSLVLALSACLLPVSVLANSDIDALRTQLEQLKQEYESRINALEQRLQDAQSAPQAAVVPAHKGVNAPGLTPLPIGEQITSNNAFNPALSIILDGAYYHDNQRGKAADIIDEIDGIHHSHGDDQHNHGHSQIKQGFNLRDVELAVSATVDPYFDARAQIVFNEDGVEVEEAYFASRALPAGLRLKGGKFLSDIGYANNQHPHQWDFTDQNLAYQVLLGGHGLNDTGLQLSWLPNLPWYTRLGAELLQGENERMGARVDEHHYDFDDEEYDLPFSASKSGPRLWTAFAKLAPDLGYNHALQAGLFYARTRQHQEFHPDDGLIDNGDGSHALQGNSWLFGSDWVYKYDSPGAHGQGDFRFQAEYLYQVKDLDVIYHASRPAVVGQMRKFSQDGLYLQGVYGFAPRWEGGLRYEVVGLTNKQEGPSGLLKSWEASQRWGMMLAFRPTEYSVLRAQLSRGQYHLDGEKEAATQFWLQYQMSLGVHGAHAF